MYGGLAALVALTTVATLSQRSNAGGTSTKKTEAAKTANKSYPVAKRATKDQETATFAAGCFWSIEHMFGQLKGVVSVEPGYSGGTTVNPTYEQVIGGDTGHAEVTNIIYDPKQISYKELLEVFFLIHDPTTKNRQGPDEGTQYRSAIYTRDETQKKAAEEALKIAAKEYKNPVVTEVQPLKAFYRAEDYHLNYYALNPGQSYCSYVIAPKVKKFHEKFAGRLKTDDKKADAKAEKK
jgi:peptide-methionine (S)-S-oxide reductase